MIDIVIAIIMVGGGGFVLYKTLQMVCRELNGESIQPTPRYKELESRVERAIYYIKHNMHEEYIHTDYVNEMIKILRGEYDKKNKEKNNC